AQGQSAQRHKANRPRLIYPTRVHISLMRLYFHFLAIILAVAERPRRGQEALDVDELSAPGRVGKSRCPQLSALNDVLQKLGVDPSVVSGKIKWEGCEVTEIHLERCLAVSGTLGEEIGKLPSLRNLNLQKTKAAGNFASLANNSQLQQLDLSHTQVSGDISSFAKSSQLKWLFLTNRQVSGDISSFANSPQLQLLFLSNTQVSGNISSLANSSQLQRLDLRNTQVSGDLGSLANSPQLKWLFLTNTQVSGDISSFANSPQLQLLFLSNTQVSGNISSLANSSQLQRLDLRNTQVSGDLGSLANNPQLQRLDLTNTHVSGDISSFTKSSQLKWLFLTNTQVSGDVSSLANNPQLQRLGLVNTQVSGDISSLANSPQLQVLGLSNTQVSGDINSLANSPQLQELGLINTQVSGDISSLANNSRLQWLDLRNTQVSGDISSLQGLSNMKELALSNTSVSGNIGVLTKWPEIQLVDLARTEVTGRLTASWRGRCAMLGSLKLSRSRVEFLPAAEDRKDFQMIHTQEENAIFPKLRLLEISGCPLRGNFSDMLQPLLASGVLTTIKADGCGLLGSLPQLTHISAVVDGTSWASWTPPLVESLVSLDLSSNKMSFIEEIPQRVQALLLADNPSVAFAAGVFAKAVSDAIFVDLQKVTLENKTEAKELLEGGQLSRTAKRSSESIEGGFACFDLTSKALQITPARFLPMELCSCSPGRQGAGADCEKCPVNHFKEGYNGTCQKCEPGSTAPEGSTSCTCAVGEPYDDHGTNRCGCVAGEAYNRSENGKSDCLPCHNLHLLCPQPGMLLSSAMPEEGHARLQQGDTAALPCLPPKYTRCNASTGNASSTLGCADGYSGLLCSDCSQGHYAASKLCEACPSTDAMPQLLHIAIAAAVALTVGSVLALVWLRQRTPEAAKLPQASALSALKEQIKGQAPILLQLCQVWAVLAVLAKGEQGQSSTSLWELPYVE
ncbi:unnamed protein product, partial [Effrenium voratum]